MHVQCSWEVRPLRLEPPQRSILVTFSSFDQAEKAVAELREHGFEMVQIDEVSMDPGEPTDAFHNLITGKMPGLGNVVLGTDFTSRDAAVMLATDPSASGMADGSELEITRNVLVTVVADEKELPRARQILHRHGGIY